MKKSILALGLLLAVPLTAEEGQEISATNRSAEAIEILKKADAASLAVNAVRFAASTEPTGLVKNFVGATEGRSLLQGWDELSQQPMNFWAHVETTAPGSEKAKELTGGGNGETYFIIDHETKKAYEDIDPGVMGSGAQALRSVGIVQFVHPTPFKRDLESETIELLDPAPVGEEDCFAIRVSYPPGGPGGAEVGSTWFISKSDYLPRRRVRHFSVPQQGEGDLVITLSDLEIDPKIDEKLFNLVLPEGYEQIDDFAP